MRYTKFEINNFKGIRWPLILDLSSKNNIYPLVGLNESWKTSILEAIDFFDKNIPNEKAHTLIHKAEKSWFTWEISVKATIELDTDEFNDIKKYAKENFNITLTKEISSFTIRKYHKFTDSKHDDKTSWSETWIELIWTIWKSKKEEDISKKHKEEREKIVSYITKKRPSILYHPNFLYDFPEKIYLDARDNDSKLQKEYRNVLQDILTYLNTDKQHYNIDTHILKRLQDNWPGDRESAEATLLKVWNILNQKILENWKSIFSLDKQNRSIRVKWNSEWQDENLRYYITINVEQSDWSYSISERSLWFRWFFSFLLFTEFRKARWSENSEEILFLLDEPASNLHQNCQKELLKLFDEISKNSKIIYSTHSHHLIDPKYLMSTYIIRNTAMSYEWIWEESDNTNIECILYKNFVASYKDQENHYKPILDAIDYSQSYLEQTDNMVYLEWKNDYYTLKYMANILKIDVKKIHFYPWASADKYDSIFRLNLATNLKFIAIFDWDSAGEKARSKYIKDISIELESKIFTLKDIDENFGWFTTESLFTEEDKIKIIQNFNKDLIKYEKSAFNAWIQNLFLSWEDLLYSWDTIKNFKKLFDFIKKKLK